MEPIRLYCTTQRIREWKRHIWGEWVLRIKWISLVQGNSSSLVMRRLREDAKKGDYHYSILVLWFPCTAGVDYIGNYMGIRLGNMGEGMGDNSWVDVVRVIPETTSDMCLGEFGISLLSGSCWRNIACISLFVSLKSTLFAGRSHFAGEE